MDDFNQQKQKCGQESAGDASYPDKLSGADNPGELLTCCNPPAKYNPTARNDKTGRVEGKQHRTRGETSALGVTEQ